MAWYPIEHEYESLKWNSSLQEKFLIFSDGWKHLEWMCGNLCYIAAFSFDGWLKEMAYRR